MTRSLGAGLHDPSDPPLVTRVLVARVALLPPERLLPESGSGLEQLLLPAGSLRGRDLGQFTYYMIQEIYWRPEGSTENILDFFSVGNVCLRDKIGHSVSAF